MAVRGLSAIDKRTAAAQHLLSWRRELVADLGAEESLSAPQRVLVESAVRLVLYRDHIDSVLLARQSLVTRRNRLLPLVEQRNRLDSHLLDVLVKLGLERRQRPALDLDSYVRQKYGTSTDDGIPQRAAERRGAAGAPTEPPHDEIASQRASAEPTHATESLPREQPASGARANPTHEEPDACHRAAAS